MPSVSDTMLVDAVDQTDTSIGSIRRSSLFRERANFRVVHEFIFNSKSELLIQQIAARRRRHPDYWGSSVAGYIFAGESYEAAAKRRLGQELGVHNVRLRYLGKTSMIDNGCLKFIAVFTGSSDGPFRLDSNQIATIEFMSIPKLHGVITSGARKFTPTFLEVLRYYESRE